MASRNDLELDKVLIWNTRIPFVDEPRTSPPFFLMGLEWSLRFVYYSCNYHSISLFRSCNGRILSSSKVLGEHFKVKTCMMHITDHGQVMTEEVDTTIDATKKCIWFSGKEREKIFNTLPWLYYRPEVKFACKFYGHPLFKLQLEIGTDSLSSVTSLELPPTTEDKSVQVSPEDLVDVGVQVSSEVPRDIESLSSDLSRLLDKEILPDVRLKCRDRTFRAHRSVLAARSDVFRAMFQNETLESETGDVTIQDMEVGVLEKLLEFVYTGRPDDLSEDCTSDLYEAADKYAVLSLKAACSYWIERHLAVENCVRYLKVADSHCDRDLKAAVISFIVKNPEVLKSGCWLALSKELPVLANEVFQTYVASIVQ